LEKENTELYHEVKENVAVQDQADGKAAEIFTFFDEVRKFFFFFSVCGAEAELGLAGLAA
jgi:hypothetical protein